MVEPPKSQARFRVHLDYEKPLKDFNQEVALPDFWFRNTSWLVVGERVKLEEGGAIGKSCRDPGKGWWLPGSVVVLMVVMEREGIIHS